MPVDVQEIDRVSPTMRPAGRPCGFHRWSNLLFAHWSVDPDLLEPLLPDRLTVDTFDGRAWIGMVPFHMSGVRPRGFPAVPGVSAFHETNIRTYVHLEGRDPGVWFFSLDAANSLAVRVARWRWHLPYFRSRMTLRLSQPVAENGSIEFTGQRMWPGPMLPEYSVRAEIGNTLTGDCVTPTGSAKPGTFEHFLAERYIMYAETARGGLLQGRVHHTPYPLRSTEIVHCEQTLTTAAGIDVSGPPEHALYSDGVVVDVFPMRPI